MSREAGVNLGSMEVFLSFVIMSMVFSRLYVLGSGARCWYDTIKKQNYFRYVDDILLIYDPDHTNIQDITDDFNSLHPNLKFTNELETNNKLNYPDITIHRTPTGWKTSIYRKPTFTDSIIP